jgi:hypothetical protein
LFKHLSDPVKEGKVGAACDMYMVEDKRMSHLDEET